MVLTGFIRDLGRISPESLRASAPDKAVSVRVISQLSLHKYEISVLGKRFSVRSTVTLTPNTTFRATVTIRGDTIVLKTLKNEAAVSLKNLKSPDNPLLKGATAAVIASGMPLTAKMASTLAAFAGRYRVQGKEQMRLAALLLDKGLAFGEEDFRILKDYVCPYPRGDERGFGDGGRDRRNRSRDREKEQESLQKELKTLPGRIKENLTATKASGNGAFTLFNHLRGAYDNWILVPFAGYNENLPLKGVIRIKPGKGERAIESLVVSVYTERFGCHAAIPAYNKNPKKVKLYIDRNELKDWAEEFIPLLRQNIGKLNCILDDTINTCDSFDGFSEVSAPSHGDIDYEV